MVNCAQRRNDVAHRKQEAFPRPDTCKELRAANEADDGDRIDTPRMCPDQLVGPTPIECLVPDEDPGPSPRITAATHATGVITVGDALEKTETTSTTDVAGDVTRDHVTDTMSISTVVLVCFMLSIIIYPRVGEQSFLVGFTCGLALFTFFYFYLVEGVLRH